VAHRKTLLVIDDDKLLCQSLTDLLGSDTLEVRTAHTIADGLAACASGPVDVVVLDQQLPDGEGQLICPRILAEHEAAKIIFVTAYPSFDSAVLALKNGAHDYVAKPFDLQELHLAVGQALRISALEHDRRLCEYRRDKEAQQAVLVGADGGLAGVARMMEVAAKADAAVLITGETGTGKNVVARRIHTRGPRRSAPFVSLNCAALPESLIEAELFGWERGAFTGSVASREGLLEMAEGGTLFLDEIGDMPLHLQVKLLSILEDGEVRRLGGRASKPVDARIIAATNASLEQRVATGSFRADLYYRLNVFRIHVPPLRERVEDIEPLCQHFLAQLAGRGRAPTLPGRELDALVAYAWPGNVRELRNVLERACLLHDGSPRPAALLELARELSSPAPSTSAPAPDHGGNGSARARQGGNGAATPPSLDEVVREHLARTLAHHEGNLSRSARSLGIALSTLKRKVRQLGLD
jgi:DNA-binding NtrC family response regulator